MSDIYVRLSRPEGYENVHPDLVVEDAQIDPAFAPLVVTDEIERLRAELAGQRDGEAQEIVTLRHTLDRLDCTHREGGDTRHCRADRLCLRCHHDEARALLRECLDWFNEGPDADRPDDLCARIDAALGGDPR